MKKVFVLLLLLTGVAIAGELSKTDWRLHYVDSQELTAEAAGAVKAFDGLPATIWHTAYSGATTPGYPHEIQIDLGKAWRVSGLSYLPRQDSANGRISGYEIYVADTVTAWGAAVAAGTFANDALVKQVAFASKHGRYVRLKALSEVNGKPWASAAEIGVFGEPVVLGPTITVPLTFVWEQPGDTEFLLANLESWGLWHASLETGIEYEKVVDILYAGQAPKWDQTFILTGEQNTMRRIWYYVDAKNKSGIRSSPSNKVYFDFVFPALPQVDGPVNLRIIPTIETK